MSRRTRQASVGISNRETPAQEAQERKAFPPLDPSSPAPEDAGGAVGEPEFRRREAHAEVAISS